ncbi:PP2C family protein-serine/threonine phosphatase [Leptospira ilyithenensis]|uniref:Protein phosphatase n=1 Tax=Leptospira ilyithenensis TaxID=2484901 RepID=A0A4V3JXJ7_9LEPT|nr:SpoIIE family protein phosphatase [Leptospira ilyithenensis]TGN13430.1 protein phosphatase [Leptospira ilyithenensis]
MVRQIQSLIFVIAFSLFALVGCDGIFIIPEDNLVFKEGLLDLRTFTFNEESVVDIKGDWEFYYGEFHYPPFHGEKKLTGYLNIPDSWQGFAIEGKKLPRSGHATLRGTILLNKDTIGQELRVFIPDVASSYRMFANGVLLGGQGKPGINQFDDTPMIKSKYYTLIPDSERVEIVFHVANYENNFGGFWATPSIGNKYALDRERMVTIARELFLLGALLIIGLYHWGLYFYRRKEKSIFYFALFCFFLGIRTAFTGNRYVLELFPEMHWPTVFRIEFASYYFAVPVFLLFIYHLFPLDANRKFVKLILSVSFVFGLTLLLPISLFTILLYGFQFVSFITIAYVIRVNAIAIANRRPNSKLFLAGLLAFASSVAVDIVRHSMNDRGMGLTPYGLLSFIFFQSLILSSRIASAFTRAEELAESLTISNDSLVAMTENLELIVEDRTFRLNSTLQRLKKDLLLAKKIQQKILPTQELSIPHIKFHLYFEPQEEVGGDFYDIFELNEGTVRFFLADATGHGIQAALYTMAIKSEYESIKRFITKTDDLMNHLNQKIQNKFAGLKIVFSCFLLDIDTKENKIYYTSAGHPDQILMGAEGVKFLPRTGNIIGLRKEQEYTQDTAKFGPGDRFFLFTDGILEQKNSRREEFGQERILQVLKDLKEKPGDRLIADMVINLFTFQGKVNQEDDQTLLVIDWV